MHQENRSCQNCKKDFVIDSADFNFYEKIKVPPPTFCPLCRDRARFRELNPLQIYSRTCAKCNIKIETSYAPERPEIIYCEKCYQQEVY